jgi:hypothetical protein
MVYFDVECVATMDVSHRYMYVCFMRKSRESFSTSRPQNSSFDATQAQVLPLHGGKITEYY